jgi:acetyltransferase-like isoleucine patch superfamily enzyme
MKANFIHPTALVESDLISGNTQIWAFVHILKGVKIGSNCNIADHAFIETGAVIGDNVTLKNNVCVWEGVIIEDDVFVGPYVTFTNDRFPRSPRMQAVRRRYADKRNWLVKTFVGKGSSIGGNATITCGVKIGCYSMIAAGATVTKDVEPFTLVVGTPARKVGCVCVCGRKYGNSLPSKQCPSCGATAVDYERIVKEWSENK